METFMGALPDYLEGPGKDKEETGRAVTLLLGVSDFSQFKVSTRHLLAKSRIEHS